MDRTSGRLALGAASLGHKFLGECAVSRKRIALYVALCLIPLIAALWIAGLDPGYLLGDYVTSTSAYVTGDLIQVGAPTNGSITRITATVGDPVETGQALAYLIAPPQPGRLPVVPSVRSPVPGTIIRLPVLEGQNVTQGQTIATIADLQKLWVIAAIDETSFPNVRIGQSASVFIPAINQTFNGHVTQMLPDISAATSRSAAATGSSAAGASSTTNTVPVRVDFPYGNALIYPGMTAQVTIYVR